MPDSFVEDLPTASAVEATDLLLLQRQVNGVWTDFRTTAATVSGTTIETLSLDIVNADLDVFGCMLLLPAPPAGKQYLPIDCYARVQHDMPSGLLLAPIFQLQWLGGNFVLQALKVSDTTTRYAFPVVNTDPTDWFTGTFDDGVQVCFDTNFIATPMSVHLVFRYVLVDKLSPL